MKVSWSLVRLLFGGKNGVKVNKCTLESNKTGSQVEREDQEKWRWDTGRGLRMDHSDVSSDLLLCVCVCTYHLFRLLCFVLDVFDFAKKLLDGNLCLFQCLQQTNRRFQLVHHVLSDQYSTWTERLFHVKETGSVQHLVFVQPHNHPANRVGFLLIDNLSGYLTFMGLMLGQKGHWGCQDNGFRDHLRFTSL